MFELMRILPVAILMAAVGLLGDPEEKGSPAWVAYEPEETVSLRESRSVNFSISYRRFRRAANRPEIKTACKISTLRVPSL